MIFGAIPMGQGAIQLLGESSYSRSASAPLGGCGPEAIPSIAQMSSKLCFPMTDAWSYRPATSRPDALEAEAPESTQPFSATELVPRV